MSFINLVLLTIGIFNIILLVVMIYKNITIEVNTEYYFDKFTSEYEEKMSIMDQKLRHQEVEITNLTVKFLDLEHQLYNMGIDITDGGE